MDSSISLRQDGNIYPVDQYNRLTSAPPHDSKTLIKYIAPRVIRPTSSIDSQGALRNLGWPYVGAHFPITGKGYGLASIVQNKTFSTISPLHSIDGERILDEQRELIRITEILGNAIVQYCTLLANCRFKELQIQWLENHRRENGVFVEKLYKSETESAKYIIRETLEKKSDLEKKLNEATRTTTSHDTQYEQLLSKRNKYDQDLFDYERQIAQNTAECQFLQRRMRYFDEETKFYLLRNQTLQNRKARLRFELDEEKMTQHTLQMELQVLQTEKISKEDANIVSFDDVRNSIDISTVGSAKPWKYYADQLNDEVQRMRSTYEKQLDAHREDLHRHFEFELYHFQMQKANANSNVTKEQISKLEQYQREQTEVIKTIAGINGNISEITVKISALEKKLKIEIDDHQLQAKRNVEMIYQTVRDRERQLANALHDRATFKRQIEIYKEQLEQYSRSGTDNSYRFTTRQLTSLSQSTDALNTKAIMRPQIKASGNPNYQQRFSLPPPLSLPIETRAQFDEPTKSPSFIGIDESLEEGTLIRFADFNVDQDCNKLNTLLKDSSIDELSVIQILCNRSVDQRTEIRDRYKQLYSQNLGDALEKIKDAALSKLLRILLLSNEERDCFEMRRILKTVTMDENILVEIFFSRSAQHIKKVQNTYKKLFRNTLEQDLTNDRDTASKKIFLALMQADRPETNYIDDDQVLKDARTLSDIGTTWGITVSPFITLLCTRSNEQLKRIFTAYQQYAKIDIEQAIQFFTDGDLARTLMAIVRIVRNGPKFFAYELKKSFKGTATSDDNLNRIIVSRCEVDAARIKSEFEKITKRTLHDYIQMNTSKNYRQAILELLRHRIELHGVQLKLQAWKNETKFTNNDLSRSAVRWKEPISSDYSDRSNKTILTRSISDRSILTKEPIVMKHSLSSTLGDRYDYRNASNSNNVTGIHARTSKSQYSKHHSFQPMPTTYENH